MMPATENLVIHPVVILSCIVKQTQGETDSEKDQEHWYGGDFNNQKSRIYDLKILDVSRTFTLNSKAYKVERNTLWSLPNPKYKEITE